MTSKRFDAQVVTAREGEMLDALVWRHYGRVDVLPLVLEANRQLARLPVAQMLRLPAGTPVLMPALNDQPVLPLASRRSRRFATSTLRKRRPRPPQPRARTPGSGDKGNSVSACPAIQGSPPRAGCRFLCARVSRLTGVSSASSTASAPRATRRRWSASASPHPPCR